MRSLLNLNSKVCLNFEHGSHVPRNIFIRQTRPELFSVPLPCRCALGCLSEAGVDHRGMSALLESHGTIEKQDVAVDEQARTCAHKARGVIRDIDKTVQNHPFESVAAGLLASGLLTAGVLYRRKRRNYARTLRGSTKADGGASRAALSGRAQHHHTRYPEVEQHVAR